MLTILRIIKILRRWCVKNVGSLYRVSGPALVYLGTSHMDRRGYPGGVCSFRDPQSRPRETFLYYKDISIQLRLSINIYSMCVVDITLHGTSIGEAGAAAHTMRKQSPIQYYI